MISTSQPNQLIYTFNQRFEQNTSPAASTPFTPLLNQSPQGALHPFSMINNHSNFAATPSHLLGYGKGNERKEENPNKTTNVLLLIILILMIKRLISQLGKNKRSTSTTSAETSTTLSTALAPASTSTDIGTSVSTGAALSGATGLSTQTNSNFLSSDPFIPLPSNSTTIELTTEQKQAIRTRFGLPTNSSFEFLSHEADPTIGIRGRGGIASNSPEDSPEDFNFINYNLLDAQIVNNTTQEITPDNATNTAIRNYFHIANDVMFRVIDVDKSGSLSVGDALLEVGNNTIKSNNNNDFHNTIIGKADFEILNGQAKVLTLPTTQEAALRERFNIPSNQNYQVYDISGDGKVSAGDIISTPTERMHVSFFDTQIMSNLIRQQERTTFTLSDSQLTLIKENFFLPPETKIAVIDSNETGQLDKGDEILNISPRVNNNNNLGNMDFGITSFKIDTVSAGIITGRIKTITPTPEQINKLHTLLLNSSPQTNNLGAVTIYDIDGNQKISTGDLLKIKNTTPDNLNFAPTSIRKIDDLMSKQLNGETLPILSLTADQETRLKALMRFGFELGVEGQELVIIDNDNDQQPSTGDTIVPSKNGLIQSFFQRTLDDFSSQQINGTLSTLSITDPEIIRSINQRLGPRPFPTSTESIEFYDVDNNGRLSVGDKITNNSAEQPLQFSFTIRTEADLQEITNTRQRIDVSTEKTHELINKYYPFANNALNTTSIKAYDINRDGILNDGDQIILDSSNNSFPPIPVILGEDRGIEEPFFITGTATTPPPLFDFPIDAPVPTGFPEPSRFPTFPTEPFEISLPPTPVDLEET